MLGLTQSDHLWLFFMLVLGIIGLPGMDMAYVMASSLSGGLRRGFAAVAGIVLGGAIHVVIAMLGLAFVLRLVPGLYEAMLLAGTLYMAWIGYQFFKGAGLPANPVIAPAGSGVTFRRAVVTCLINPKAYLFMLAVFPQFVRPDYGSLAGQAIAMGAIITLTQAGIYGAVAVGASGVRDALYRKPVLLKRVGQTFGLLIIALAIWSVAELFS